MSKQIGLTTIDTAANTLATALRYEAAWLEENAPERRDAIVQLERDAWAIDRHPARIRELRKHRGAKQR